MHQSVSLRSRCPGPARSTLQCQELEEASTKYVAQGQENLFCFNAKRLHDQEQKNMDCGPAVEETAPAHHEEPASSGQMTNK